MGMRSVDLQRQVAVKGFPWRKRGVLLPAHDRRTAALGICMFTASKPHVLAVQRITFWSVRALGGRVLPGRKQQWTAPFSPETWSALIETWQASVGKFDGMAVYQRRQAERDGLTILMTRGGAGVAIVKVRSTGAGLRREQQALAAIARVRPATFQAPAPMGSGTISEGLSWSAQTSVFDRPHRPVYDAPPLLFDEIRECLDQIAHVDTGVEWAHNDLTPWNLRRDSRGAVWLYDWEEWASAPAQSDRVYFCAAAHALTGSAMPPNLERTAIAYWRKRLSLEDGATAPEQALRRRMVSALDEADRNAQNT